MSRKLLIVLAIGALLAGSFGSAIAALSVHQNALWGSEGACAACHNNNPTPALRGWGIAGTPPGGKIWYGAKIAPLCYPCHRSGNAYGASPMENYAYDDASHGNVITVGNAPYTANSWSAGATLEVYTGTGLPYVGVPGTPTNIDCTTCHNVHNNDYVPFSMKGAGVGSLDFSTLCKTCHTGRTGGAGVAATNVNGIGATSTHPTDIALANLAGNGATQFVPIDARVSRTASVATWNLGGKRTDGTATGNISCQTCHAVHGDEIGAITPYEDLLAIPNVGIHATGASTTLCIGCHGNPYGTAPANVVGSLTDHPIDGNAGWAFYPSTVAADWASAVGVPISWVAANHFDSGATSFDPTLSQNVACSSCHDTHGGITATSMLRGPNTVGGGTGDWCFNCHPAATLVPDYHHSTQGNWASSALFCGDCHGTTGATNDTWSAHNGFYSFRVAISATNSLLCEACHTATNPMVGLGEFAGTLATPAHHGPAIASLGTDSHAINTANLSISNLLRYTGNWAAMANGPYDIGVAGGRVAGVVSEWGAAQEVLCESCHNILENVGNRATSGSALTGGYEANLLLLGYEDDNAGVAQGETPDLLPLAASGDLLCRVCHNLGGAGAGGYVHYPAAHTVPSFTYAAGETPYGRSTAAVLTDGAAACPERTTADAVGAPGAFSYIAAGATALTCDSCHRPHNGWTDGAAGTTNHVTVQSATALTNAKTNPCAVCHSVDIMCGY
jgi:hypothetical protein